jgi:hypothetical protein
LLPTGLGGEVDCNPGAVFDPPPQNVGSIRIRPQHATIVKSL